MPPRHRNRCAVIEAIEHYYRHDNSNIHRGVHTLSERATEHYEKTRRAAKKFINAADVKEIIFVRGTTDAINLVAQTYGRKNVGAGDEVLITAMEHHSNIVPWQMLCEEKGAKLRVAPINDRGELMHGGVREASRSQNKVCLRRSSLQRAWHHQPGQADCSHGARRGTFPCCWMARRPFRA